MRSIRPHRFLAAWFVLMAFADVATIIAGRFLPPGTMPDPTFAELRWTVFYSLMQLLSAYNLWRNDPFGWRAALFFTSLRIVEGTLWEIMDPLRGAAVLVTGISLVYHGLILTALDSKALRRIFPDRRGPLPRLGFVAALVRTVGASITFFHFSGFFGAVVPPLFWLVFRVRNNPQNA